MGNRAVYYGDCKSPYSAPADGKSAGTGVLYYYTPTQNSIYIRKVKSYKDLYRNLGF